MDFRHTLFAVALTIPLLLGARADAQTLNVELYGWSAPAAAQQVENDSTVLPAGRGAVLVPTFSTPEDEPEVLVVMDGEQVASGRTGQRIVLSPGTYEVVVGSGAINQASRQSITVVAGETVLVEPSWGGMIVEVVDSNNIPHRGGYEIIRTDSREIFGLGYGADTLQGERLQTWMLPEGLYRIVRPGLNYRARQDFATVYIPEGGLVNFKLVIDPVSGSFQGAGVVPSSELGIYEGRSRWSRSIVLGVDGSLSRNNDVVGQSNQFSISGDLFVDIYATYTNDPHLFSVIFEVEEGLVYINPQEGDALPLQKSNDRLRTDLLYTYFLTSRVGPYVRAGTVGSIFPSSGLTTEDATVRYTDADGTVTDDAIDANNLFRTGGWFGSQELRQGAGMNFRVIRHRAATLDLRLGAGLRQNLFNEAYVSDDDTATPELEFTEVEDFTQEGAESTIRGTLRLTRYLHFTTDAELFAPFDDFTDPAVDWQNTLSVRLSRFASIDYDFDLTRQPQVTDDLQTSHSLLLRLAFEVL